MWCSMPRARGWQETAPGAGTNRPAQYFNKGTAQYSRVCSPPIVVIHLFAFVAFSLTIYHDVAEALKCLKLHCTAYFK